MAIDIRPAASDDTPAVLAFWRDVAAPTTTDDAHGIAALLARDPGALLVAESSGRIVGTVIAAWDGWRGNMYRLAVDPRWRPGQENPAVTISPLLFGVGAQCSRVIMLGIDRDRDQPCLGAEGGAQVIGDRFHPGGQHQARSRAGRVDEIKEHWFAS